MTDVTADPLESLRLRTSEKWAAYPADVLPLFVAEMDYPLAPVVADAMVDRIRASDTGYVGSPGALGEVFSAFAERRWGWRVDPRRLRTTTDVSVAIVEVLRQIVHPGDGVVIMPPVYPPFWDLIDEAGARAVEVPLLDDGAGWSMDLTGIEQALVAGARVVLLCSPHNPLGHVHGRSELEALAALAEEHGATVVSDEIHAPLVHQSVDFTPFLAVSAAAREHGICVTSASKAFNLAGVKCAVMVAGSESTARILERMPLEVGARTSILGLHASVAAFRHGDDWLDGTVAAIERSRDLLATLLDEHLPKVGYRMPRASFLAWLDFRDLGWGDDPSVRALEARVALNPGPSFGREGVGHARLNLACSPEVLTEAVQRLAGVR